MDKINKDRMLEVMAKAWILGVWDQESQFIRDLAMNQAKAMLQAFVKELPDPNKEAYEEADRLYNNCLKDNPGATCLPSLEHFRSRVRSYEGYDFYNQILAMKETEEE